MKWAGELFACTLPSIIPPSPLAQCDTYISLELPDHAVPGSVLLVERAVVVVLDQAEDEVLVIKHLLLLQGDGQVFGETWGQQRQV